jgi:hypothetical protein
MALAGLRKGTEEIKKAEKSGGNRFTNFIGWKDGDVKLVYFLTKPEEIPKLMLHSFVEIPYEDDEGEEKTRYDTFVCRKDPAFREESGNTCELCDRVGHKPTEKFAALALELEGIRDKSGKRVVSVEPLMRTYTDREGVDHEVPQVGLVIQASRNFFSPYVAFDSRYDLEETSFEIERDGASTDTKYFFFAIDAKPDLTDLELPDLEDVIERMGSEEKYEAIAEVTPGSQKTWGDGISGKGKNKKTSSKSKKQTDDEPAGDLRSEFERIKEQVKGKRGSSSDDS